MEEVTQFERFLRAHSGFVQKEDAVKVQQTLQDKTKIKVPLFSVQDQLRRWTTKSVMNAIEALSDHRVPYKSNELIESLELIMSMSDVPLKGRVTKDGIKTSVAPVYTPEQARAYRVQGIPVKDEDIFE
jgi:hypothetical protein